MRLDLNRICIAGLVITLLGGLMILLNQALDEPLTVGRFLGEGAPLAHTPVWMVLVTIGALVYLLGRIVWLAQNRYP